MILIITHRSDFTADFVINKLNQRQIPYKRFNCEDVLKEDYNIRFDKGFSYHFKKEDAFHSVWFRRTKLPEIDGLTASEKWYVLNEVDTFTKNIFSVLDAKWLSDPFQVYRAENKLLQLKIAQNLGFSIPKTLLTSSKEELANFYQHNNKQIIVKPLSQTRIPEGNQASFIYTNKLGEDIMERLGNFDLTPAIYQQYIEKEIELRVTVVGQKVFAAAVDSQADPETSIDWRRKRTAFRKINLPGQIQHLCIALVKALGLQFGAIDLIKTPQGEYVFLEINPNGQWAWIESETGLAISDAIIDLLQ